MPNRECKPWDNARSVGPTEGTPQPRSHAESGVPVFLALPMPPSINEGLINRVGAKTGRGRALAMNVRDWKMRARVEIRLQKPDKVPGPVLIVTNLERVSKRADVDNRVKFLLDLLVAENVIDDDRNVTGFAVAWSPPKTKTLQVAIHKSGPLALNFHPSDATGAVGAWAIPAPKLQKEEAA